MRDPRSHTASSPTDRARRHTTHSPGRRILSRLVELEPAMQKPSADLESLLNLNTSQPTPPGAGTPRWPLTRCSHSPVGPATTGFYDARGRCGRALGRVPMASGLAHERSPGRSRDRFRRLCQPGGARLQRTRPSNPQGVAATRWLSGTRAYTESQASGLSSVRTTALVVAPPRLALLHWRLPSAPTAPASAGALPRLR